MNNKEGIKPIIIGDPGVGAFAAWSQGLLAKPTISVGRCQTCKHWSKVKDANQLQGVYRLNVKGKGICSGMLETKEENAELGIYVSDDSGLYYDLFTKPDFGCLNFKGE